MFDWNDYLKVSQSFVGVSSTSSDAEAYYRCAISRAYYSVFHKSKAYVLSKGYILKKKNKKGSHQEVIKKLSKINNQAGGNLGRLHYNRVTSDYYENSVVNYSLATFSISLANSIIGQLK